MFAFVSELRGKLNAVLSVENASEKQNALKIQEISSSRPKIPHHLTKFAKKKAFKCVCE